ncbi:MAG TPA: FAD-dependent monooxygenase [Flavobacteriales bacterium]|nr:FAD-dependent monooxygenase [Flavobacteriales bacterium]
MNKVVIIGGGLVGSLLAIFLAKRGFIIDVYEKRPDMRKSDIAGGRSINLVISDRGWKALKAAGIEAEIQKLCIPVLGRMTHDLESKQTFLPYSRLNKAIYSVSRGELNERLITCAEAHQNVTFYFNHSCESVDHVSSTAHFLDNENNKIEIQGSLIFGADGANSKVRKCLLTKKNIAEFGDHSYASEEPIDHGYKELIIPANADGSWKLDKNALHIWPRKQYMLMALANLDGGFTCTLFFPFKGSPSFESIKREEDLMTFFHETFPDAVPLMPTLVSDYFDNPSSSLMIVKCFPWTHKDKIALIGDAAHAIVPFYGEGMNCGFEDCRVLDELIEEHDKDWTKVLSAYQLLRKPNGDAIADLSLRNFIEMRDLVADPTFLLRKKIESKIFKKHPEKWVPLYSQVKFSDIPYAEALAEGLRQDKIMEKVMSRSGIEESWDSDEVEKEIVEQL